MTGPTKSNAEPCARDSTIDAAQGNTGADASRSTGRIRLLFFVKEPFPTHRVDVDVLFGRELLGRGHEIDFVMQAVAAATPTGPQQWRGRTVWVGATDSKDGFLHRLRKHVLGIWHDLRSLRLLSSSRYDAVQVRDKLLIAAVIAVVARRRGLKFFYWLSFPHAEAQVRRALDGTARYAVVNYVQGIVSGWLLYRWILPRCSHVFVQSEQMRADVSARGIDPDRLTPVPMGVSMEDLPNAADRSVVRRTAHPEQLTLMYLGTLSSQRRLEILIDMLHLVRTSGFAARLLLVGDGEKADDRLRLERRARELGIDEHLEITGFLPRGQALAHVAQADVCLSPFFPTPILRSTSPTKLVEYLAMGLPVVANNHPEQRLVLRDCRAGICVPWGARYFAKGVIWLLRQTPETRCSMGERGRQWVLNHRTYDHIADDLERTYLTVLYGGTRSSSLVAHQ